jgi:DNA recombination protein RmuC
MDIQAAIMVGSGAVLGLGLGALAIWLWLNQQIASLKARLAIGQAELTAARAETAELPSLRQAAQELRSALAAEQARNEGLAALELELTRAQETVTQLTAQKAAIDARLETTVAAHAKQVEQLTRLQQDVQENFKALAGDVLRTSNEDFSKRAEEIFRAQKELTSAEIDRRSLELSALVAPLGETLKTYQLQLQELESTRMRDYGGIHEALRAVRDQHDAVRVVTTNLVTALRASPKTRGRWGEETLRRVMEMSGMVEHCDFETEKHFPGTDDSFRPDAIIHVAGGRTIVVDAKAPVSAYLESIGSQDESERDLLLTRHAKQLRERLTNLSSKSYWEKVGGSLDCVVMFVPGDNFVSAAFERDPDLFEDGIKNRVLICTPTTFIALAKAVSYGWRQEKLAQNALEVAKLGKNLYARLATLGDYVSDLGRNINGVADKYNKLVKSLESRVMPQARRFHELGVEGTAEPLEMLEEVETVVRFPLSNRDLLLDRPDGTDQS